MKVEISKKQNKKAAFSVYLQKVVVLRVEKKHQDIMQTVIIFYFGGRTVEKAASHLRSR
jgi:hypothetical protein